MDFPGKQTAARSARRACGSIRNSSVLTLACGKETVTADYGRLRPSTAVIQQPTNLWLEMRIRGISRSRYGRLRPRRPYVQTNNNWMKTKKRTETPMRIYNIILVWGIAGCRRIAGCLAHPLSIVEAVRLHGWTASAPTTLSQDR